MSPLSCRTLGLSKSLFVGVLLGMDLVVQKVCRQFVSIVDLQLPQETNKEQRSEIHFKLSSIDFRGLTDGKVIKDFRGSYKISAPVTFLAISKW